MNIDEILVLLRIRTSEYILAKGRNDISIHVNAVFVAIALTDFALREKRVIKVEEEGWFKAGYNLQLIFEGSEWVEISDLYLRLADQVVSKNFFR